MNDQDRALLENLRLEMNGKFTEVLGEQRLTNHSVEAIVQTSRDHETRLRSVEKWKAAIPLSALLVIVTIVGTAIGVR